MATIEDDRETVRHLLTAAQKLLDSGDPEATASNAASKEAESIMKRRESKGEALDLLTPLLSAEEPVGVRFGAASFLMSRGHADLAAPVLESLDLVEAKMVLDYWRRQQGTA